MFGLFRKDPKAKLEQAYKEKLEAAMKAQRNGDIRTYSELSAEADALYQQLQKETESS